jgi:hypothetical protein
VRTQSQEMNDEIIVGRMISAATQQSLVPQQIIASLERYSDCSTRTQSSIALSVPTGPVARTRFSLTRQTTRETPHAPSPTGEDPGEGMTAAAPSGMICGSANPCLHCASLTGRPASAAWPVSLDPTQPVDGFRGWSLEQVIGFGGIHAGPPEPEGSRVTADGRWSTCRRIAVLEVMGNHAFRTCLDRCRRARSRFLKMVDRITLFAVHWVRVADRLLPWWFGFAHKRRKALC